MTLAAAFMLSYLVGAIPTGLLIAQRVARVDVRTVGSGSTGATNVTRAAGWGAGLVVFLLDAGKGLLAALVIAPILVPAATPAVRLACGLFAVVGHVAPVFLGFKGGKGVATTIGTLAGASPMLAAVYLAVWGICFAVWRFVSVGSIVAAASLPMAQALLGRPGREIVLGGLLALLIIVRHRANIDRLLRGTEHRAGSAKSS